MEYAPVTPSDSFVGVIDQGTMGTRFVLFDAAGNLVGEEFEGHRCVLGSDRSVEFDPVEIWQNVRAAMQAALSNVDVVPSDIEAIGIANQRQTVLLWDANTGDPRTPAISWQDRRAAPLIDRLTASEAARIRERTGLVPDPYFAGPTLAWLLTEDPEFRAEAEQGRLRLGTIDTWLLSRLTDRYLTDITNAAQTMLVDIDRGQWDSELLELFDIPRGILPRIRASSDPTAYGRTDLDGLLDTEIPITAVMGDQQAALLGHGGSTPGTTKISHGAGNFVLQNVGAKRVRGPDDVLSTIWFQRSGEAPMYGVEGPVLTTGTMIGWLDELGVLQCDGGLFPENVDPTRAPTVIPTLSGSGTPHWRDDIGGAIIGLDTRIDPETIVRGAVDGIAFATREALEAVEEATGHTAETVYVDGAPVVDDVLVDHEANHLDRKLVRPPTAQVTAIGVAYAAGIARNIWADPDAILDRAADSRTVEPREDRSAIADRYGRWRQVRALLTE